MTTSHKTNMSKQRIKEKNMGKKINEVLEWITSYDYFSMPSKNRKWLIKKALEKMGFSNNNTFGTTDYRYTRVIGGQKENGIP